MIPADPSEECQLPDPGIYDVVSSESIPIDGVRLNIVAREEEKSEHIVDP